MAGRLSALFDELEASLKASYSEQLAFGRKKSALSINDAPPRVVWILGSGRLSAADKRGGRKDRALMMRNPMVRAHCWGETFDDAEELLHHVAVAIYRSTWGSLEIVGEEWPEDALVNNGDVGILLFGVQVPVGEPTRRTVKATTFEKEVSGSTGDGWIEWGR